jgi:hypothetical protein
MGNFSASLGDGGPFGYDLFVNNVSNAAGCSGRSRHALRTRQPWSPCRISPRPRVRGPTPDDRSAGALPLLIAHPCGGA